MVEIEKCVPFKTPFKAIKITEQLGNEVREAFETARKQDDCFPYSNPKRTWKMIYKFHGIVWSETFGFYFLANYGTENQRRQQSIWLNDRIIESPLGEQFLLSEKEYQAYFMTVI